MTHEDNARIFRGDAYRTFRRASCRFCAFSCVLSSGRVAFAQENIKIGSYCISTS